MFQTNKLPVHQHIMYQLCDIHDSEIQAIVAANDGEVGHWSVSVFIYYVNWDWVIQVGLCMCVECTCRF